MAEHLLGTHKVWGSTLGLDWDAGKERAEVGQENVGEVRPSGLRGD